MYRVSDLMHRLPLCIASAVLDGDHFLEIHGRHYPIKGADPVSVRTNV